MHAQGSAVTNLGSQHACVGLAVSNLGYQHVCVGFGCFKLGVLASMCSVWPFQTSDANMCVQGLAVSNLGCQHECVGLAVSNLGAQGLTVSNLGCQLFQTWDAMQQPCRVWLFQTWFDCFKLGLACQHACVGFGCFKLVVLAIVRRVWLFQTCGASISA